MLAIANEHDCMQHLYNAVAPSTRAAEYEHNTIIHAWTSIYLHCANIIMTVSFYVNSLFLGVRVLQSEWVGCLVAMNPQSAFASSADSSSP
jgi:hypothetical protein